MYMEHSFSLLPATNGFCHGFFIYALVAGQEADSQQSLQVLSLSTEIIEFVTKKCKCFHIFKYTFYFCSFWNKRKYRHSHT